MSSDRGPVSHWELGWGYEIFGERLDEHRWNMVKNREDLGHILNNCPLSS